MVVLDAGTEMDDVDRLRMGAVRPILGLQRFLAEFRDSLPKGLSNVREPEYGCGFVQSVVLQWWPLQVPSSQRLFWVRLELGAGHCFP